MNANRFLRPHGLALVVAVILTGGLVWMGLDVATNAPPAATQSAATLPATAADRYDRIDAYVADQLEDSRIPGAALAIVEDGEVVHATGFGADGHGNQIAADTPFWIGSNTKSVTALAVMQLVEDGLIELDAPVQRYLPDFRVADPDASQRITVRHLLNQTSGISRIDSIKAVARGVDQPMRATVADLKDLQLNRPVGESFEYANLNSVVLGVVVEAVTGQNWQDYVEAQILRPLGMGRTFADKSAAEAAGLTSTYRTFFGFPLQTDAAHLDGFAASGYLYSTPADMGRYLAMYLNGGSLDGRPVLSEAATEQMLTGATDPRTFTLQSEEFTASYGAGWFVGPFGSAETARWHQGSLPHFTAWMVLLPDTDQAVVVLLNKGNQFEIAGANAAWSQIPQGVVNLLVGQEAPDGPGSMPVFIILITVALATVTAQVWTLARLVRDGIPPSLGTMRAAVPLSWELGLAGAMLVGYPSILGGLGWSTTLAFLPDLTLLVLVVGGLAVATGAVRAALLIHRRYLSRTLGPESADELARHG